MTPEAPTLPRGETQTTNIEHDFREAYEVFSDISTDPRFHALRRERGIAAGDMNTPAYWEAVADLGTDLSDEARDGGEPEGKVLLQELFTATPDFVCQANLLDPERNPHVSTDARMHALERVSYFNGLIRDVAKAYPEVQASTLGKNLLSVANKHLLDPAIKHSARFYLNTSIRGAQHELAFAQLLKHTGRTFWEADTAQDLTGTDYLVQLKDGSSIGIDVKASLVQLQSRGRSGHPYDRVGNRLIMYSLLRDSELNDHFYVSDEIAAERARLVNDILEINTPVVHKAHTT